MLRLYTLDRYCPGHRHLAYCLCAGREELRNPVGKLEDPVIFEFRAPVPGRLYKGLRTRLHPDVFVAAPTNTIVLVVQGNT